MNQLHDIRLRAPGVEIVATKTTRFIATHHLHDPDDPSNPVVQFIFDGGVSRVFFSNGTNFISNDPRFYSFIFALRTSEPPLVSKATRRPPPPPRPNVSPLGRHLYIIIHRRPRRPP